ncbi:hypothetical protein Bresa_03388|uniref:Restriction endonuclease type II BglI domain-containing protein n=1 Tax=Brenneria salicis ATCC 15712 = DSM 30166 TaxID=714314 RepID=A0A366HWP7_9GAMM|nr:BglI family type II restriction endonuclease [Brenneria salicis]NMN93011.1 hypothetical protein [Brenneria salicis ATCC 15712 = DSM 30166]RBP57779.1 hypothetical protein DES54_1591 [Brenneria salicis ATCC 15712 = DSM 30166]RLM28886.1 hypothetical protein BHG07_16545 [Brenneria salicis ATCC 15712 = DSM 30166]
MNLNWISEYNAARNHIISRNSDFIIQEEIRVKDIIINRLLSRYLDIKNDFDNAYQTKEYWEAYAPMQCGYKPRGEAYPWGEVGEKVIEGIYILHLMRFLRISASLEYPMGMILGLPLKIHLFILM